ncbi:MULTISPECIES: cellulose biosynthesis protein BcsG [unclassified Paraburkholderia]|uniref:cellulose biosynthesis protein BcsG n=1 Tax=unclassified Paraburkholderia TaxID=2615204 RepID=UPI002AB0F2B4|nr:MULTISPECIES: cellulose biosynthesis protein BcsG [unclassified Paraburkholderia]
MGLWNLYFAAKLYLFSLGKLQIVWLLNILFAVALLVPLHWRWLRITRNVLAVVAGFVLFYHESGWPPISRAISQIPVLLTFTPSYMLELLGRLVSLKAIIAAVLAVLLYFLVNRWIRVTTLVLIALVGIPLYQGAGTLVANATSALADNSDNGDNANRNANEPKNEQAGGYDQQLAAFRSNEEGRHVTFTPLTSDTSAQFDIIVVHICSLSWDDMDVVKMRNNPLFSRFDYVFQNFSSGASYSGPAAIRVLRASCGQEAHKALYDPAPPECHLFTQLAQAGFTPNALLNHNGRFDNFRGTVINEIGVPGVTIPSNDGLPVFMKEFDNSNLYDDYDVIARWYKQRIAAGGGPVALYYNTVSMHDGNRLPNNNLTSLQSYPIRLQTLLGDVDKVINLVAQSGRKAVIVFVPEHGAALRGEENQIAGMREIPTPNIVHVPVGVKVVGLPAGTDHAGGPVTIDQPTSYLALAQLLANLVAKSPFAVGAQPLATYAQNLPQTRMVGENEGTVTMATPSGYVIHTPDGVWVEGK